MAMKGPTFTLQRMNLEKGLGAPGFCHSWRCFLHTLLAPAPQAAIWLRVERGAPWN